jgi:mRNA deadenylase 3'-5' endonuclease subunit Ccr4
VYSFAGNPSPPSLSLNRSQQPEQSSFSIELPSWGIGTQKKEKSRFSFAARRASSLWCASSTQLSYSSYNNTYPLDETLRGGGYNLSTTNNSMQQTSILLEHTEEELKEDMLDEDLDEFCGLVDDFGCEAFEELRRYEEGNPDIYSLVRMEARADDTLKKISSREDVQSKMNQVLKQQSQYGMADLYTRYWEKTSTERTIAINSETVHTFSVAQFNALAEGLSAGPDVKTPFSVPLEHRDTKGFGGFSEIPNPNVALDFSLRRWRLMQVILGGGIQDVRSESSHPFDLIALEEVDRFRGFFSPILRMFGYAGIFVAKPYSPGVQMGWYSDGCSLFWKTSAFELLCERRMGYKIGNQVFLVAALRHRASQKCIVVAVTHLKASLSEKNEKMRCKQVEELLEHAHQMTEELREKEGEVPVLIMGDFNADPPQYIPSEESSVRGVLDFERDGLSFQSAYDLAPERNDLYTTWKTRGAKTTKRIIDYIFHTKSDIKCTYILSIPKEEDVEEAKLPGLRYPSDHLMIAAKFEIE